MEQLQIIVKIQLFTNKNGSSSSKTDEKATTKKSGKKTNKSTKKATKNNNSNNSKPSGDTYGSYGPGDNYAVDIFGNESETTKKNSSKTEKPQLQRRIIQKILIRMTMVGQISINMVN